MTIIVADTLSGLKPEKADKLGIKLIPQQVIFGEQTYQDDKELSTEEFLLKLRSSKNLPKTAAPIHHLYFPIFSDAAKSGETVIVIGPTGKMSGTIRSAETARQEYPSADIRIIDTMTIAGCLGSLVLIANDMVQNGKNADEIVEKINSLIPKAQTFFVVDTLEYLKKGGRIGTARALLGELLQVKPILQLKEGQPAPFEQERTKKRAVARLIEIAVEKLIGKSEAHPCVMHIDAEQEALQMCAELKESLGIMEIPLYILPPAIIVHAGPKALAVGFFA